MSEDASGGRSLRPVHGVGLLVLLGLWLFRGPLMSGRVLYRRDIHLVWYAQIESFVRGVAAGSWPLWNPSLAFGRPLLADPGAQVLYPLTWLNLLMRPWTYYAIFALVHALGSAIGTFFVARRLKVSVGGSAIAGSVWLLSGPYLSTVDLWHHYAGFSWLPWVVLAALHAVEAKSLRAALVWGAIQGLQVLAGSADACALTSVVVAAVFLRQLRRGAGAGPSNRRLLVTSALAALIATGLTAALWWPALEQVVQSSRADLPAAVRTYWSVHPLSLLEFLVPGLWTNLPLSAPWRAALFESREPFLGSLYLGAGAIGLVLAGVGLKGHPWRGTLFAIGALSLVLALGNHTPIYGAIAWAFPPLRILRYPVKLTLVAAFAWALLAGIGWDAWREAKDTPRAWRMRVFLPLAAFAAAVGAGTLVLWLGPKDWTATVLELPSGLTIDQALAGTRVRVLVVAGLAGSAALLAWLRGGSSSRWPGIVAGALAVADLAAYHRNALPLAPLSLFTYRPPVLTLLSQDHPRVYVYDYSVPGKAQRYLGRENAYTLVRQPQGWDLDPAAALGLQMYVAPESAGRWGLRGSYEIDYRGLYPSRLEMLTQLLRRVEGTPIHHRLLRMAGVTDVIALHSLGFSDLEFRGEREGLFAEPIRVFGVPDTLPRAYAVGRARVAEKPVDLAEALMSPAFDPSREVVLAHGEAWKAGEDFRGSARVTEEAPDRVQIEATLNEKGYVVLVEGFDPGWRAEIDGREAPVLCANGAFRAVRVDAGRHLITQTYRPRSVQWGAVASVGTLFLLVGGAWGARTPRSNDERRVDS